MGLREGVARPAGPAIFLTKLEQATRWVARVRWRVPRC